MRKYYKYGKGPITDPIALVLLTIRGLAGGRGLGSEVKNIVDPANETVC